MGLSVSFSLPFARRDVWHELVSSATNQLGVDPSVTLSVLETGPAVQGKALAVGMVRTVSVPSEGATTSKLIALEAEERIAWEVLAQRDCEYTLRGRANPTTTIQLTDVHALDLAFSPARPIGTRVTMAFDCDRVSGPGCFPGLAMQRGLAGLESVWQNDMMARGYTKLPPR